MKHSLREYEAQAVGLHEAARCAVKRSAMLHFREPKARFIRRSLASFFMRFSALHFQKRKAPLSKCFSFLEAPPRFELGHKGFADLCLTTWLWRHIYEVQISEPLWSGLRGSNPPPRPWQGRALPNELNPHRWFEVFLSSTLYIITYSSQIVNRFFEKLCISFTFLCLCAENVEKRAEPLLKNGSA